MSKARYIMNVIVYLLTGFLFGMGIIDNDPFIKILCTGCLMLTTVILLINTWFVLKGEENATRTKT